MRNRSFVLHAHVRDAMKPILEEFDKYYPKQADCDKFKEEVINYVKINNPELYLNHYRLIVRTIEEY